MHVLVKYKKDRIKYNQEKGATSFYLLLVTWGISVVMETRVLVKSALNLMQPFPYPIDATHLIKIGQLASEIFKFEILDDDGRTTDHWYTISSPCEPSAQVS